jgi:hypothetical protein
MPRKKEVKSVEKGGKWIHVKKMLILGNMKAIFNQFKHDFPYVKIGFSRFCGLPPRHVILAGATGTHPVYVRVRHQHTKLADNAIKLNDLTLQ